ncbi:ribosomal protein S5 domain 2-type protein [Phlyctochytrium arcticum]|nr:ribosomal protein S5 domain 2-type protein [Phlyctochytrium arcticum]
MEVEKSPATNGASGFSLDPETFKKIHPHEYQRRFLSQGIRADGRTLKKFRNAKINTGAVPTAHGSAMVRLGETTVICGIKAEISEPQANKPRDGYLVPNLDLPPLCSPQFKPGPPGELAQTISEYLDQTIKSSHLIDLSQLCIESGKAVWVLYADIVCLNYEGNAMDAAFLALIAALQDVKLPIATFHETDDAVRISEERSIRLKLNSLPLAITFGISDGNLVLADPDAEEEAHLSSTFTVVMGADTSTFHSIFKPGGSPINQAMISECLKDAKTRVRELSTLLKSQTVS